MEEITNDGIFITTLNKLCDLIAWKLPEKILYYAVARAWSIAITSVYTTKMPDEINVFQVMAVLNGDIPKHITHPEVKE
jgi:hypothetical protein